MRRKTVSWFSAGVSSAIATKLAIKDIDEIMYIHIKDQHSDSLRFVKECQDWFKKPIKIINSKPDSVEEACLSAGGRGYINGPAGAACSLRLKRAKRMIWEKNQGNTQLKYVWGMDYKEKNRCTRLEQSMPMQEHEFSLVAKKINKEEAHKILTASGISRPKMYDLGYMNNNCVGCVKGGMGYWNKIRKDFPQVFKERALLERKIGASCIKGVYLDELGEDRGREQKPIVPDCGMFCDSIKIKD